MEGVVALEALLGLQRQHHRGREAVRQREDVSAGGAGALPEQQGDPVRVVEELGGPAYGGRFGAGGGRGQGEAGRTVGVQFPVADVARHGEERDALVAQGVAHRRLEELRQLVGVGDGSAEDRHVTEEQVVVDFLEGVAAQLGQGDLAGAGQDGRTALGRVVEAVEEVHGTGADRAHAHPQAVGELGLGARGEGRRLLVTAAHPLHVVGGADGVGERVERVSHDAEHLADAEFAQGVHDDAGDGSWHGFLQVGR